jgi:ethanolaminephosphotransferase
MCISPLPQETLANMNNFKYRSTDDSIMYNKCMSPCLNVLVNYLPRWLAPNLITFISLCFNIFAAIISYSDGGFDFSAELKPVTCIVIGVFQFIYQLLDNIDGKQARRTGNSTPFGMLMDHGCDVFTNIFTAYNLSKLAIVGNDDLYSFSVFFGLILGFYMMTYEEYKLGEMHFPPINGTDEGNFFIFLLGVVCGLFGQDFLYYTIIDKYSITVGKVIQLGVVLGGLSCIFNLYLHTYKKKGFKEMAKIFLDNVPFYSVVVIPIYYIIFKIDFYTEYKWIILCNSCLIFARITIDIQIKILTLDTLGCNYMVFISNIIYIITVTMPSTTIKYYTLLILFALQSAELCGFIYIRAKEITTYLNIRIFCVNTAPQILNTSI